MKIQVLSDGKTEYETETFSMRAAFVPSFYELKRGESLQSVSKKFSIPLFLLKKANEGVAFECGVTLFLPKIEGRVYTVKPLDTFEKLEREFGVSPEEIKEKNGIDYLYASLIILL